MTWIDFFPPALQHRATQEMHVDPEFETYTYRDPTMPKRSPLDLRVRPPTSVLCGAEAWPADGSPEALYIVGYFVVSLVGLAASFTPAQLNEFSKNAHVREALTDQAAAFIFAPGRGEASAESNCRYLAM
jgi:hypothetical protein